MWGHGSTTRDPTGSNRRGSLAGFARSDAAVDPEHGENTTSQRRNTIMDTITTILIIGVAAQGVAFAAIVLAPPLYAWTDRWLDRTHKATAHEDRE